MDRTAEEHETKIKSLGLKLAAALEYYASYILETDGDEDMADAFNQNADVVRAGIDGMFPAQDCWTDNVVPLRAVANVKPTPPDRPRCRG